ncbi:MAG: hypothetical protein N3D12_02085 [Candidatus Methanomethyliaceae archaeon]|nr:hypothetical protein [Candidatus Methanomethyliaceae archaeon]
MKTILFASQSQFFNLNLSKIKLTGSELEVGGLARAGCVIWSRFEVVVGN